jgi:hypothetical protein
MRVFFVASSDFRRLAEPNFEIPHPSNPNVLEEIIWIEKAGESILEKSSEIYAEA